MNRFRTRADVRRMLALNPEGKRSELAPVIRETLFGGEQPPMGIEVGTELLRNYLLDPVGGALLTFYDDERGAWFDLPVFDWVGPGNAVPIDDVIAAIVVAPALCKDGALVPELIERRFAPRADEAVAQAVAALPVASQPAALAALWADKGPEPQLLALSLLQCARVVACTPGLFAAPNTVTTIAEIVDGLIARLSADEPRDLSRAAARALGGIAQGAPTGSPFVTRIRDAARAAIAALAGPAPSSFADEIRMLSAPATPERWGSREQRDLAAAAAYIIGVTAPRDADAFAAVRDEILNHPESEQLGGGFIDGLVAAVHLPALISLANSLLQGSPGQIENALALASRIPFDPIASALAMHLDSPDPMHRAAACGALALTVSLEGLDLDTMIAERLGDPDPEVCAAAARTLVARGRSELIARHSARESNPLRRAIALAAIDELSVPVIGELVTALMEILDQPANHGGGPSLGSEAQSPVVAVLRDALFGSLRGLDTATALLEGVPDAAAVLALATAPDPTRDYGILAPTEERATFARVALSLAQVNSGTALASLALYLLSWISAGDATIADHIAAELGKATSGPDGSATNLLAALGEIRIATPATGAALAPYLAPSQDIVTRMAATSIAGRALPATHEAWASIRELLAKGSLPRITAWTALRDRARRSSPPIATPPSN